MIPRPVARAKIINLTLIVRLKLFVLLHKSGIITGYIYLIEGFIMSKKTRKEPSQAKRLVMQVQFRSQSQKPLKGKGSYRRKASHNQHYDEAFAA